MEPPDFAAADDDPSAAPALPGLRRRLRAARRRIDRSEQRRCALLLARRLSTVPAFQRARRIAAYWPADGEIDPRPALARAFAAGKACYLPVLCGQRKGHLRFAPWWPGASMRRNRFGIAEPAGARRAWLSPHMLDVVILPLVGFDAAGSRLGMGGGYYDRSFAFLARRRWRRPRLIGVAFEAQRVAGLPRRPWDVPLDAVLTAHNSYGSAE